MKQTLLIITVMCMLALTGCTDFESNCYKTLKLGEIGYTGTMLTCGDLYDQGDISEESKDHIIAMAKVYKGAYEAAKTALIMYHESENKPEGLKEQVVSAMTTLATRTAQLRKAYEDMTAGIKGVYEWNQQ